MHAPVSLSTALGPVARSRSADGSRGRALLGRRGWRDSGLRARGRSSGVGRGGAGRARAGGLGEASVGRADVAELDVRVDDLCVGRVGLDVRGCARAVRAGTAGDTGSGWVGVGGVGSIEPEHVDGVVVPDGENEDGTAGEGLAHGLQATVVLEGRGVAERRLLLVTVGVGDGVDRVDAGDAGERVGDDDVVLDVEAADLAGVPDAVLSLVRNWVTTVNFLVVSTVKPGP